MDFVADILKPLELLGISSVIIFVLGGCIYLIHKRLLSFYADKPGQQHHRQLIMVCVYLFMITVGIILVPISDETQGQLLSFLAILLSATIALSSTTIVGNAMAGLMLKALKNCRPGDFISVTDSFGRISKMDLLHVEIQTEDRDLITLPNLHLVTNPVRVLRSSGTMLRVEVSLGYEVPRQEIEVALLKAAEATGLEKPYVQIRELGDFAVSYQVSGLLTDVEQLLGARRKLRANVLDSLHAADIEIVSPTYMNTRAMPTDYRARPVTTSVVQTDEAADESPDDVAFDKAQQAEALDFKKKEYTELSQELIQVEKELKDLDSGADRQPLSLRKKKLEARLLRAEKEIARMQAELNPK